MADEDVWGWRAIHSGEPEVEEALTFYCPACALIEFGWPLPRRSRREA